ncbi:ROK family transcriptional regulator [Pararhizobium mangrovi]|uniref:ROK family transcriptional regulator n=1 Tax=Pararhizobium mangrovi TaxID=2590452 RepID=A0A506U2B1_9HYPH|nr:ROK family transcriptional regulator [Pararhizobium mangrovi]TPW27174.1 ROK family transcriptional regulator [Pararhizobium mangrovi]
MDAKSLAIGNNPPRNREHNRRVILDTLRRHGEIGRAEIARITRLSTQSVANIVKELMEERLIVEIGRRSIGRGQPPIQFAVNPDGPLTAGIELTPDRLVIAIVDLTGTRRASTSLTVENSEPDAVAALLMRELPRLLRETGLREPTLLGIGVVMPGPFGIEGMSSVGPTTLPGWGDVDAAECLGEALGHTVIVDNDANAAAVGEHLYGAGSALEDFCVLYFGTGIGLGMFHKGQPYHGAFGNAGEIGHVVVAPGGRACSCGQHGCLEQYASLHALRDKLGLKPGEHLDFAEIERLHDEDDPLLLEWLEEAARHLLPIVATLENILDPETIVLGGMLPGRIVDSLIQRLEPLALSVSDRQKRQVPRVMHGQTGQFAAALGAASLPLLETIAPRLVFSTPNARFTA